MTPAVRASPASAGAQAQLRIRPTVQGAALVLENKTGRILAMAGSFSYGLSQLQPHLADPAPARLGDEAAHLFDGAAIGTAAQHSGARRPYHVAADWRSARRPDAYHGAGPWLPIGSMLAGATKLDRQRI